MKQPTARIGGGVLGDQVGIGWLLRHLKGVRTVGHGGSTSGQESALQLIPERDFAITILTNAVRGERLHTEILRWAFENYLGIVQEDPKRLDIPDGPSSLEITDSARCSSCECAPTAVASSASGNSVS
jgi:hypothetical protein